MSNARSVRIAFPATLVSIIIIALFGAFFGNHGQALAAAPEVLKWTKVNIPTEGAAGGWVLAAGSDIRHLTAASDGTLYACYVNGPTQALYKSTNGGLRWSFIGNTLEAVTGIAVSPDDADIIYYATTSTVYRSADGGKSFSALPEVPDGVGTGNTAITSIAVIRLNNNIIAVGTRDSDNSEFGGVYVLDEGEIIPAWENTDIGNYDVYAVDFSPDYATGRQIVAVVSDETDTYVLNKIGNAGWNAFIGPARLNKDNSIIPASIVTADSAVIAFPTDYSIDTSSGNSFFFVGINTGTDEGDTYKIVCADAPEYSLATDLNCGFAYGLFNNDISGLAVHKNGEQIILVAGSATYCRTYISKDGGKNWIKSKKEPTGDSGTEVLLAPDFADTGLIYAASSGVDSAVSISRDIGFSWNQISMIDTVVNNIIDFVPSPDASRNNAIFMITSSTGQSLWRSMDDGSSWERLLCSNSIGVDNLNLVNLPPQYGTGSCRTVFTTGESNGNPVIWESTDNGQSFLCHFILSGSVAFNIDVWAIIDESTIYAGSFNGTHGMVYVTTNTGATFSTGTLVTDSQLYSLALSPDFNNDGIILVGDVSGEVFLSLDSGSSFQMLPADTILPPLEGSVSVAFDPDFSINQTVYAAGSAADAGIYRFIIGFSQEWKLIDNTLPVGAAINCLSVSSSGALYAANTHPNGGMERCLNPDGLSSNVRFETITSGLNDGAALSGLWQHCGQLWSIDIVNHKLMTYYDTLSLPPSQVCPEDTNSGIGSLVSHTIRNITLEWETIEGATSYEWQCNYDTDFSVILDDLSGTTSADSVRLPDLEPATTYFWRVRACEPVYSPWSEPWSFTTSMDTEGINLKLESPAAGATEVSIKPVFQWTAVLGAEAYELLVATDPDFNNPVIIKMNAYALQTNVWNCDVTLDYDTVYYWKIRATTGSTCSPWSSTGIFTTISGAFLDDESAPKVQELIAASSPELVPSPAPTYPAPYPSSPASMFLDIPVWLIILIVGLLGIVLLTLLIVLVIVLKLRLF